MIDFANGKFSEKALDFFENSDARLDILHGSVRSSKTVNCTIRWITFLFDGPPGDLFMIGKTRATLQRNVLNDMLDIVGDKNYRWIDRKEGEIQIFHRRIYCIGANNEDSESKIRGATIAGAYCDEANLYPLSFWMQLMARMSVEGAQCFANCNPEGPNHWFYKEVITNDKIKNKKIWHFTLEDNPNLSEEYVTSLKQMYSGVFYKRYILGLWVTADGAIYDMFDAENQNQVKSVPMELAQRFFVGVDYATATVMSWSLIGELPGGKLHKFEEYYYSATENRKQKTDSEFAREFLEWIERPVIRSKGGIWMTYVDPSAASYKLELRNRGLNRVVNADNDVVNGIRAVSSYLTQEKYSMDPSCVNTIREYQSYSWDPKAQEIGVDKPIKVDDHACDSDRYVIYYYSKHGRAGVY